MATIKLIFLMLQVLGYIILVKVIYDLLLIIINHFKLRKEVYNTVIRRVNILKALELYWLSNTNTEEKDKKISVDEVKEMTEISEKYITESLFKQKLQESKISYCYSQYLYVSRTPYAKTQLKLTQKFYKPLINKK